MKKLNGLTITTTKETYEFSDQEARSAYEQWDGSIGNSWEFAILRLENRTIILNVSHIVELYCTYVEEETK